MLYKIFLSKWLIYINIGVLTATLIGLIANLQGLNIFPPIILMGIFTLIAFLQLIISGNLVYNKKYILPIIGIHLISVVYNFTILNFHLKFSLIHLLCSQVISGIIIVTIYYKWFSSKKYKNLLDRLKLIWVILLEIQLFLKIVFKIMHWPKFNYLNYIDLIVLIPMIFILYKKILSGSLPEREISS